MRCSCVQLFHCTILRRWEQTPCLTSVSITLHQKLLCVSRQWSYFSWQGRVFYSCSLGSTGVVTRGIAATSCFGSAIRDVPLWCINKSSFSLQCCSSRLSSKIFMFFLNKSEQRLCLQSRFQWCLLAVWDHIHAIFCVYHGGIFSFKLIPLNLQNIFTINRYNDVSKIELNCW